MPPTPLDLLTDDFPHGLVVEASAGTGKTYSVAAIVTLELALHEDLRIGQILITTFTRNAAAELRDRVRKRIAETADRLRRQDEPSDDRVVARLQQQGDAEVANCIRRLERALVEFDTATITTIHGVCSRVLRIAGLEAGSISDTDETERIVTEAVNDLVVSHSTPAHRWDEKKVEAVVNELRQHPLRCGPVTDPFLEAWIDPALDPEAQKLLEAFTTPLKACVARIQKAMTAAPSFNDLLRIGCELVCDDSRADLLAALKDRFALAIVDEAQDTDQLQWEFFNRLFPGGDGRRLISVGDPKQSIYGFRGADVRAYMRQAKKAGTTDRTLVVNFRSDQPVLDGLNITLAGKEFGAGIEYRTVDAPKHHQTPRIQAMPGSVEFLELGEAKNQGRLAKPVLDKVLQLLDDGRIADEDNPTGPGRAIEPRDICVLVRSGSVGQLVQQTLRRAKIPAVTGGTSSVMASSMALDIRALLEAMERPSDLGRVRRVAATRFFGHSLAEVGSLTDDASRELQDVQDRLLACSAILVKKGIATLGATIEADEAVMARIAGGQHGERNVTDFLHVIELMDASAPGKGCSAERALEVFSRLANMDDKHELVARRVESDADAVRIYTIHAAKGLEFPCVIVADRWTPPDNRGGKKLTLFHDDDGRRKLDLSFVIGKESPLAASRRRAAEIEEARRLIYVAATRAQHYLAVLVARMAPNARNPDPRSILEETMTLPSPMARPGTRTTLNRKLAQDSADNTPLTLAPPPQVERTYRRMSFTGIAAARGHGRDRPFEPEGGGYDELNAGGSESPPTAPEPAGARQDVIDLPAGVAVGRVVHEIFEHVDPTRRPLTDEVRRVVVERATSGRLKDRHEALVRVVTETLETPLGGPFGDLTLGAIPPEDRLSELIFDMGLSSLVEGIRAQAIGALLLDALPKSDILRGYATLLAGPAFNVPVGGLLTGSIDALLRLPESTPEQPRLLITDYKSNKLHKNDAADPLAAYAPDRLVDAMVEHHYPLQALLYGTAVYRMLRWRLPEADPDACIAGVAYAFIRGMKGPSTPVDEKGHRYGVFAWQSPLGLWKRLSDLFVTRQPAGAKR
jgi:exodeoxyribonuclease V beta subunit